MRFRSFCISAVQAFTLATTLSAQQEQPKLDGVITDSGTGTSFQVNGVSVFCSNATKTLPMKGKQVEVLSGCPDRTLGLQVQIFGNRQNHGAGIEATTIQVELVQSRNVHGQAVVDALPSGNQSGWTFRADGYRVLVTSSTALHFLAPLQGRGDIHENTWVTYSGKQNSSGVVVAEQAEFRQNLVRPLEDKVRQKEEFDPAATKEEDRQNRFSKAFLGLKPKRLPAYRDLTMQTRVESIGDRLVPAYQKRLVDNDPTKINFRFQVVDEKNLHDAISQSNGIILVPYVIVERLENDSQLATVLADNIAAVLEKQEVRVIPVEQKVGAGVIAGNAVGFFVPGLGLATGVGSSIAASRLRMMEEDQSGRVSLGLLGDAGFDVKQAPLAWWLLVSLKQKPIQKITMPHRAAYLYEVLGRNSAYYK